MNRSLVLLPLASLSFAACSSAPADSERSASNDQSWRIGAITTDPLPAYDDACPDGSPGCTCETVNTTCWASAHSLTGGTELLDGLLALGCNKGGYKYQYRAGSTISTPQQYVHQCPDTRSLRSFVEEHASDWNHPYVGSNVCDACLPAVSAGKVYVFWNTGTKPNCPSGCKYPFPPGT
jgi:hypothetical protein